MTKENDKMASPKQKTISDSTPEKMPLTSLDVAADKREQLKSLFPESIVEGKVDFDQLKRALGEWVDGGKERFGLSWPGKADCMKIIQQPSVATLKPENKESLNFNETKNVFIEGDNLEVLKLLQKSYFSKVKMIYIDPPYNTGNEFIYPDKFSETLDTYLTYTGQIDAKGRKFSTNTEAEGRYHSNWLNMMYPRLYLAKNLLKDDGLIFISIDDHEQSNLKQICDQIFGEENFIASIIWQKRITPENRKSFSYEHDYVLCYAKSGERFKESQRLFPLTDEARARYKNPDNDPRGVWLSIPAIAQAGHGTKSQFYKLKTPNGRLLDPPEGCCWRYNEEKMKGEILANNIWFGSDGNGVPRIKRFLTETRQGLTPSTLWLAEEAGANEKAKKEVSELFGGKTLFDSPKPTKLIQRMLNLGTDPQSEDIVLDFFAGSGTTAHAVLAQNLADNGNRRFILVQLPEAVDVEAPAYQAGYKVISDLSRERIRLAGKKLIDDNQSSLGLNTNKIDVGFKAFKLDRSNFKEWNAEVGNVETLEAQLEMHIHHVRKSSKPEEILFELLLKAGFELTINIGKMELAGKQVYSIENGALLICLEDEITIELIDALANANPIQVICLDAGFKGNDQLKTNAVQTFKSRAQSKEQEIVFRTV